ncbi:11710e0e-142a-46de-943a-1574ed97504a [Thermothielavioides terrestris]|uniref:11710e0e-142a-46de-943a-1574ed97504a n=1 Tax=Thermothielavioides terrestris TaxID=2587410 RepID=A0A446B7F8_9PEZI|nr:11710e0e-142a-46de-943a-1574ed97504a [Thermothielavioides terrestris]
MANHHADRREAQTPELWDERDGPYQQAQGYGVLPQWQGLEHCATEFCLFSNREAGEGIALITTARNAYLASNYVPSPTTGVEPTAYYEAEVPGKGRGLIANRTIRRGEIIMQRLPVLLIQMTPHVNLDPELREQLYQAAVDRLPEPTRARFMRQMGATVYDKVEKNSFRMFVDDSLHLGMFPDVSKFNHDCRPNVHYRINNLTHTTIAVRDIPRGEELTISYIYPLAPLSTRQTQLRDWDFTCTCAQCTLPATASAQSDARIRQIAALEDEIEAIMARPGAPGLRPAMGIRLIELHLEERLHAYLGPAYTWAAIIAAMFGDEARAREYAAEAALALEREVGPHAKDAKAMRRLADDVRGHWAWGLKVEGQRPL